MAGLATDSGYRLLRIKLFLRGRSGRVTAETSRSSLLREAHSESFLKIAEVGYRFVSRSCAHAVQSAKTAHLAVVKSAIISENIRLTPHPGPECPFDLGLDRLFTGTNG